MASQIDPQPVVLVHIGARVEKPVSDWLGAQATAAGISKSDIIRMIINAARRADQAKERK